MQHFGCPTRLLDWTKSPFVATYFAVFANNLEQDGLVWAFNGRQLVQSDSRPKIQDLRDVLDETKDNEGVFWCKFPEDFIHPFVLKRDHIRSVTQQGVFTVCGRLRTDHADVIDGSLAQDHPSSCLKFVIGPELKMEALRKLMRIEYHC